ncbi:hypothetical protein C8J56DRAFT_345715 [Mycena floridula]|nr:hypothetical protein C8J56DRAFT_345715 [Mycena floridula]
MRMITCESLPVILFHVDEVRIDKLFLLLLLLFLSCSQFFFPTAWSRSLKRWCRRILVPQKASYCSLSGFGE